MRVSEWLWQAEQRLSEVGINSTRLEARMLAAHVLETDWSSVFAHPEWEIDEDQAERLLERRESREPLAYILGWREFYGRQYEVNPSVLIPRQETETLVEEALRLVGPDAESNVLDLGCGSGCIGITIKLERPQLSVLGSDISAPALETARRNARKLGADVPFIQADLFEGMDWRRFDMILTNPPYIANSEELMPDVALHEPAKALYAGDTGLEFYERLAGASKPFLKKGGWLLMEVGYRQASFVSALFEAKGWKTPRAIQDLSGVDRVLSFHTA